MHDQHSSDRAKNTKIKNIQRLRNPSKSINAIIVPADLNLFLRSGRLFGLEPGHDIFQLFRRKLLSLPGQSDFIILETGNDMYNDMIDFWPAGMPFWTRILVP